ncbi:DNA polymerase III subunit gamma and tau [Paenarthrobacter sp. PH39-S1]|uniref:DNA polymerase III subunit gamma and tau n=1 Tax=Paenarthrobacter sp. PH39-S1 TaxID=3046204 RepID=UPI0024BB393F|nr:DNA polymerase III subunit gamma and tau [Paenarthrobacter sp. PH39-S1]MDJ0354878.1 DNA polymerase III subunit gamma and tau [Paenarthrobacter sp. PH39-S1]
MTAPTALYRRYRPDSFADVIGQEHVTEPLMAALQKNRVNHAYLFSGPRGCGKTTSARILARCLNCAEGPAAIPCGKCDSCIELARGGSGSLDVIEIDAASHGGVDDARDLRERATFAPVRDRYKIFIIDEAHMVTSAGFNALLKIVEEPPEHIKFIFATTEPDKVIGTIRSRTHHYPFRLVPPEPLMEYLGLLCRQENVPVAPGVLSLVIRAGGGSVRDSLSVLDQLMAGAGPAGLDYELAVSLLGYTHASLLDDVVDALAASDAATVFKAVDRVIQTGHDPRRFVEDLLERFRDLIIVRAMPESAHAILRGMPDDQIARMQTQSTQLGAAELSRAADVTNTALTEMTGATSPRLHLELLSARLLLPGADQSERGMAARLDRIERRLSYGGAEAASAVEQPTAAGRPAGSMNDGVNQLSRQRVSTDDWPVDDATAPATATERNATDSRRVNPAPVQKDASGCDAGQGNKAQVEGSQAGSRQSQNDFQGVHTSESPGPQPPETSRTQDSVSVAGSVGADAPASGTLAPPGAPASGATGVEVLRRAWPEILDNLTTVKRSSWALVAPNATPQSFDGETLQLAFRTAGLAGAFSRGDHSDNLRAAINKTLGMNCRINAVAEQFSAAGSSSEPDPKASTSREFPAGSPRPAQGPVTATEPVSEKTFGDRHGAAPQPQSPASQAPAPAPAPAPATQHQAHPTESDGIGGLAEAGGLGSAVSDGVQANPQPIEPDGNPPSSSSVWSAPVPTSSNVQGGGLTSLSDGPRSSAPSARTVRPSASAASRPHDMAPSAGSPAAGRGNGTISSAAPGDGQRTGTIPAEGTADGQWNGNIPAEAPAEVTAPGPAPKPNTALSSWGYELEEPPYPDDEPAPEGDYPPADLADASATAPRRHEQDRLAGLQNSNRRSQERASSPAARRGGEGSPGIPGQQSTAAAVPRPAQPAEPGWGTLADAPDWATAAPGVGSATVPSPARESSAASSRAPSSAPGSSPTTSRAPAQVPAASPTPSPPPGSSASASVGVSGFTGFAGAHTGVVTTQTSNGTAPDAVAVKPKMSLYERLKNSPEAQAGRIAAPKRKVDLPYVEDIPSADDETIESSGLVGRAAVERILGGRLVEERSIGGS